MATLYVSQDGAGAADGSTAADAFALTDVGVGWNWAANEYYLLGTLTTGIVVTNVNGATLRGDYITGVPAARITGIAGVGVQLSGGTRNSTVHDLRIDNCTGRGLYQTTPSSASTSNKYHHLTITDCGGNAIRIGSGTVNTIPGVEIYEVTAERCADTAIFLIDAPAARVRDVVLRANGVSGAGNYDGLAFDDGCHGSIAERVQVFDQMGSQGGGIDSQASDAGDTDPIIVRQCLVVRGEGVAYTNTGVPETIFDANIADSPAQSAFYTKGTATGTLRYNTSINPGTNHLKSGDTGGDAHTMTVTAHLMVGKAGDKDVYHNDVGTLTMDECVVPTTATYTAADAGTNAIEADVELNDDYEALTEAVWSAATWVAGVRAYDDNVLPMHPDPGAVQPRDRPGRRQGAGAAA